MPLGLNPIRTRQIRHQITRQELTRPLLPNLPLQILHSNLQVTLFDPGSQLLDPRRQLPDQLVDIRHGDGPPRVEPRAVFHPLPELHARDFGGGGVLHEVVQRDAAVAPDPGCGVGECGGDVGADAFVGDFAWDFGVEEVGGGDFDFLAADVVLLVRKYKTSGKG